MHTKFDERKTTQASALFMHFCGVKEMPYIKLIKLLYLVDREALFKWGRPVTFDKYVSMNNGPVLSQTLDLITEEPEPGKKHYWFEYMSEPKNYAVSLKKDPGQEDLSEAEVSLIKQIADKYGKLNKWKLIDDVMHKLPEWVDPNGSAIPIDYKDILRASNKTPQEIVSILEELDFVQSSKEFLEK